MLLDPVLAGADLVTIDPCRHLVVVAPHPDDEVIGFGGAIFDHVAVGGEVTVVTVTDGEAFDQSAGVLARAAYAAQRRTEQAVALAHLGVAEERIVRLGFPDGEVATSVGELAERLGDVLRAAGAPSVVTPWRRDGHADHEATNQAVRAALGVDVPIEVPIWSWHRRAEEGPSWTGAGVLAVSPMARRAKRTALRCHVSQLTALPGGGPAILSTQFLEDFDRSGEVICW